MLDFFMYKYISNYMKTPNYYRCLDDRNYQQVLDREISNHACTREEAAWRWECNSNHTRPNKYV